MTGRLLWSPTPGVHMLSTRQFSLACVGSTHELQAPLPVGPDSCGHLLPNRVASRTAVQGLGVFGGRNRFAPPVGAPYGIPLKTLTPSSTVPRMGPKRVETCGECCSASATCAPVANPSVRANNAIRPLRVHSSADIGYSRLP